MRLKPSLLEGLRSVLAALKCACAEIRARVMVLARKVGPSGFSDLNTETAFLDQYRMAGLKSTSYACCVAITGYLLIGTVEIAFNGWSAARH